MIPRLAGLPADRPWIIPYLTAGYPHPRETVELLLSLEEGGADAIELGLPWSDPLADGPVIQAASQTALEAGIDHRRILGLVEAFRKRSNTPLLLMGYANPILAYGPAQFFRDAAQAGADGLIVPDLPIEEAERYLPVPGLAWIHLAAPTSSEDRLRRIDALTTDFVYVVALTGVTGVRDSLPPDLRDTLHRAVRCLTHPFVVGFGFSRGSQIHEACPPAAGVVIGSALLRAISGEPTARARRDAARRFTAALRS